MEEQKIKEKPDSGLSSILLVARYYGIPADEERIKVENNLLDRETDIPVLLKISRQMKLKAKLCYLKAGQLEGIRLPAVIRLRSYDFAVLFQVQNGNT